MATGTFPCTIRHFILKAMSKYFHFINIPRNLLNISRNLSKLGGELKRGEDLASPNPPLKKTSWINLLPAKKP
jgi:hypothetical protein